RPSGADESAPPERLARAIGADPRDGSVQWTRKMKAIHIAPPYSSLTASIRMKSRRRGGMRPAVFLNSTGFSSRHELGGTRFARLEDYAADFFNYLNSNDKLIPTEAHEQFTVNRIVGVWLRIRTKIDERVEQRLREKGGEVSENELRGIVDACANEELDTLKKFSFFEEQDEKTTSAFIKENGALLAKLKREVFEELPISSGSSRKLRLCAGYNLTRQAFDSNYSGIVIAGYGTEEIFPRLTSHIVDGTFSKKLRIRSQDTVEVGIRNPALVSSFAQSDMITTFMEGVNPEYRDLIDQYLALLFSKVTGLVADSLAKHIDGAQSTISAVKKEIDRAMEIAAHDAIKKLGRYRRDFHVDPITHAVGVLPKEELASMAEALVHLTSLKRRVSMEEETVGGPIDVAVISRGDGMVWIKRKHYFDKELNHHFFANYFVGARGEKAYD
ncbi:hypothetical protein, partial [Thiococcus pfennigii]|uniref:hypothetical protein n=1 Tax=Thiococcus pfennigii TaxID=1057 RepID=UPI001A912787